MEFKKKFFRYLIAALLIVGIPAFTVGCTQADVQKAVALIQAEIPTAVALLNDVLPVIIAFSGTEAQPVQANVNQIKNDLAELQTLCQSYASSGTADVYNSILKVIDDLVMNGDTALLAATHITNSESQQKASVILGALSATLHILDGYIQATQTTDQVRARAQSRQLKLSTVRAYWSDQDQKRIEQAMGHPFNQLYNQEVALGF